MRKIHTVSFDFRFSFKTIERDKYLNFECIDFLSLHHIAKGKLYIFFEPKRTYLVLKKVGLIDCLLQLRSIINAVEAGEDDNFPDSSDYSGGALKYSFKLGGDFFIRNNQGIEVKTDFYAFKEALKKFYENSMQDLLLLYPGLAENKNFQELLADQFS